MQTIIDFDEEEEQIIEEFKKKWNLSKNRAVRQIIRKFGGK